MQKDQQANNLRRHHLYLLLKMISTIRRGVASVVPRVMQSSKMSIKMTPAVVRRSLVTLSEKERGDEELYIRRLEKERHDALKAQVEDIMTRQNNDPLKHAVISAIGKYEQL